MDEASHKAGVCACPHHRVMPLMVTLFGILFFLGNIGALGSSLIDFTWPILVIVAGGTKLLEGSCRCCGR